MAKIISTVTAFFLLLQSPFLFLFGVDGREFGKVTLVMEASSYPVGTEGITAILHNGTFRSIARAGVLPIYKWDGDAWVHVPPILYFSPVDPNWLRPLQSGPVGSDLTNYDPPLDAGRYRLGYNGAYAEFMLVGEGKVSLTTEFDTYPLGTEEIKATLYNGALKDFEYTAGYRIQKLDNSWDGGKWGMAGPNLDFPAVMCYLQSLQSETLICNLSYCDPPLEAGRYRIGVGGVYGEFTLV